tara:strand:- start:975 stop:1229 length:255 start_codon:yes stop_codon:yes gene_type:complete
MSRLKKVMIVIASIIVGIVAFFMGRKADRKTKNPKVRPPKNTAADVAIDHVQENLKEELDRIESATTGDSPADDLADLGNARRR